MAGDGSVGSEGGVDGGLPSLPVLVEAVPKKRKLRHIDVITPVKGGELNRHSNKNASKDLGGLFIDRLNTRGSDLVDEGFGLIGQAGDDDGDA